MLGGERPRNAAKKEWPLPEVALVFLFQIIEMIWDWDDIGVSKNSGTPKNGWFRRENPIKMDDLGVSLVLETPIWDYMGC